MRINHSQEFVIGSYIPSHLGVDSIIISFNKGKDLLLCERQLALGSFVPSTRREVYDAIEHLGDRELFVRKPATERCRQMGSGFTAEKMREAVQWGGPEAVAQIEFLEWTGASP